MKKLLLSILAFATAVVSFAQVSFYVNPPSSNSGNYPVNTVFDLAEWGSPDMTDPANAVDDTLVIVQGVDSLGCDPLTNGTDINGQIALVWRGACEFGTKAFNAQNAGAIACIIVNNDPTQDPTSFTMLGGADGLNVTIPVAMIGTGVGQLLYDEIMAGNSVTAFLGNKFGYFANDIGIGQKDVLRARQFATPIGLAANDTEFSVPVGAWVFNFGSNAQTNVTLNAKVSLGANVLYDETSMPVASLASGDSVWIPLPTFSESSYTQDYYEMAYSISADAPDEFSDDNSLNADFMFTENEYTYATVDPATVLPVSKQYFQPSTFTSTFGNCIHFVDANASRKAALGLTFAATSTSGTSLADEIVAVEAYEWTDAVTDFNDPAFDISLINLLAAGEFTYTTDSQQVEVYMPVSEPLVLVDDKDYIFCVTSSSQNVFLGYDNSLDYDENIRGADLNGVLHGDGHTTTMVNNDNSFTPLGFGTDLTSGVMINMVDVIELGIEDNNKVQVENAFPNPANENITVLLNGLNGTATLTIVDIEGKVVANQTVNINNSQLTVDVRHLANGMYVFNLNLEDGKTSTFNVVVSK